MRVKISATRVRQPMFTFQSTSIVEKPQKWGHRGPMNCPAEKSPDVKHILPIVSDVGGVPTTGSRCLVALTSPGVRSEERGQG